jgi:glycosyltransferase involved in cell wall biosynthesis
MRHLTARKLHRAFTGYDTVNLSMAKKKILMLCDHPLSTSGVGTQSRWIISGLIATGKYSFRVFGGAVKHQDYKTIVVNPDFIIKPTDGFGDRDMLRQVLATEKPDAVLLFTDPRFFIWVWEMEDEIHQLCPIAYNHLWDNPPWPEFNRVLYESTDLINCINYPTYEMVHQRFPEKTNYIPHGVPHDAYKKMSALDTTNFKRQLLGQNREDHFVMLYVSRNARRKMPSDILLSFKQFLNELETKHGHKKATLVMHTDPLDPEGPNLIHVIDMLHLNNNVIFSKDRVDFAQMNALYNMADVVINRSCNEGFGLSVLEAKMAEKPCIVLKTGGLTRQIEDHVDGYQFGVGLDPEVRSLVGNQLVPYIYEDFVSHETVAKAIMQVYDMGPEKRAEIGRKAREHALRDYNMDDMIKKWDESLTTLFDTWKPNRLRHEEL